MLTSLLRSVDQTLVKITIGDGIVKPKTSFMIHEGLLCAHSKYFRKAFKGDFRESTEKTIHLPDISDSTLRLFQFWLYGQSTREAPERVFKRPKTRHRHVLGEAAGANDDQLSNQAIRGEDEEEEEAMREIEWQTLSKQFESPPAWLTREGKMSIKYNTTLAKVRRILIRNKA